MQLALAARQCPFRSSQPQIGYDAAHVEPTAPLSVTLAGHLHAVRPHKALSVCHAASWSVVSFCVYPQHT
jgi:hypothetical protein